MKKRNIELKIIISVFIIFFLVYIIIDYFNVAAFLGLHITNLNMEFFDIFFNSFIAILLYIITYYTIDKKQINKENNATSTAYILMLLSYKKCKDTIELFDKDEIVYKYVVPKVDFEKTPKDNPVVKSIESQPFETFEQVLQMSQSGQVSKERLQAYFLIFEQYKLYVSLKITFFDVYTEQTSTHKALNQYVLEKREKLMKLITEEIAILEKNEI